MSKRLVAKLLRVPSALVPMPTELSPLLGVIVWLRPVPAAAVSGTASNASVSIAGNADAASAGSRIGYEKVQKIFEQRCYLCHGTQVQMKNMRVDSPALAKQHAQAIYQQVVVQKLMPMNNATGITDAERALIGQWFEAGAPAK